MDSAVIGSPHLLGFGAGNSTRVVKVHPHRIGCGICVYLRHANPDFGLSGNVPGLDLIRQRCSIGVDEPQIVSAGKYVAEVHVDTVDERNQHREVDEIFGARATVVEREPYALCPVRVPPVHRQSRIRGYRVSIVDGGGVYIGSPAWRHRYGRRELRGAAGGGSCGCGDGAAVRNRQGEYGHERDVAARIGPDGFRSEEDLTAGDVGIKIEGEVGICRAVQAAGNRDFRIVRDGGSQHRIVLQRVDTDIGVADIIGCESVIAQIDVKKAARIDGIARDRHPCTRAGEQDAVVTTVGDDVRFSRPGTADDDVDAAGVLDAVAVVAEHDGAGSVDADEVALDDGAVAPAVDAFVCTRYDITGPGRGTAYDDVIAAEGDGVVAVLDSDRTGRIGADEVALDGYVVGIDLDAVVRVVRDDISLTSGVPSDQRAAR